MRKKIIVANWKTNPDSVGRAVRLAREIDRWASGSSEVEVVIAPPFPYLIPVYNVLKSSRLGAQDAFWEAKGANTGEVSAHQLKHLRVEYVIIGHSERRALYESDLMVNKKIKSALHEGLKVILCVGEPKAVRQKGIQAAKEFVRQQLKKDLEGMSNVKAQTSNVLIAYEPIWAISAASGGRSDTPENAVEMIKFIRKILKVVLRLRSGYISPSVLYGGSVNAKNAEGFLREPEIDGALVGGASLKVSEFGKIIKTASRYS